MELKKVFDVCIEIIIGLVLKDFGNIWNSYIICWSDFYL